jgi:transcriptional regulator with XRE-family HTH domain
VSEFGEALRRARAAAGLSQNEVGRRAKINPGTVNQPVGARRPVESKCWRWRPPSLCRQPSATVC